MASGKGGGDHVLAVACLGLGGLGGSGGGVVYLCMPVHSLARCPKG